MLRDRGEIIANKEYQKLKKRYEENHNLMVVMTRTLQSFTERLSLISLFCDEIFRTKAEEKVSEFNNILASNNNDVDALLSDILE